MTLFHSESPEPLDNSRYDALSGKPRTSVTPKKSFPWTTTLSGVGVVLAATALTISLANSSHLMGLHQANTQLIPSITSPGFQHTAHTAGDKQMFLGSSELIADVAEAISPSVVNIDVQHNSKVVTVMPFNDDMLQRFFGFQVAPMQQHTPIVKGNGSGVIISADGDVLTNNHVVNGADEISVTTIDGKKYKAKVIGRDPFTDLALVRMEGAHGLKPAPLGVSKNLRPGEWVIAVGSPLGFDHTVTLGIVSALSRQIPDINANVSFIQTDPAINPGNSGGPLVNLNGEVIGINTAIAGSGQNIGFAIPVDTVKQVTQDLLAHGGHITRPWLGISLAPITPDLAKSLGLAEDTPGVVVAQVVPNSPSARAGFQQGDVIQRINGTPMKTAKQVQDLIRSKPVNTEFHVQIMRNGQLDALSLHTDALPDQMANPAQAQQQQQQEEQ